MEKSIDPIIRRLKIKIPNTEHWVLGEQLHNQKWNIYIVNHDETLKQLARENITSRSFALLTNVILGKPFPYE